MEKQFISRLCGGFLALFFVTGSFAQTTGTLPTVVVTSTTNVNQKVSNLFKTQFKDAVNPTWSKLNKDYLVTFITGDMSNRALYKKNGALVYHIGYGHENNLPKEVRQTVKSNYVDHNIIGTINVQQDRRDIWIVNLQQDKNLVIVRVEDGALEEVGNYAGYENPL
jgi:hypothetical protein